MEKDEPIDDRPSISGLQALRKHWPARIYPVLDGDGDWSGEFDHSGNELASDGYIGQSNDAASMFAELLSSGYNADPVLLEIAAAALKWLDAEDGLFLSDEQLFLTAARNAQVAFDALRLALSKVRQ